MLFSPWFSHTRKLVNKIIHKPKCFINNCFTDARATIPNFEQWLQFTNVLRPVNLTKQYFWIFSQSNRSSATAFDKLMSMQIHMLSLHILTKNVCFTYRKFKNWACILHLDLLHNVSSYFCYIFFINTILFSEAVLRGFSYEGVF